MRLGDAAQREHATAAGVGIQDVEAALLSLHLGIEPVEVGELGRIRLHTVGLRADGGYGCVEARPGGGR